MAKMIPVLPLARPVLYPGMIARVHVVNITEVSAVEVHLATGRTLAIVPPLDPLLRNPGPASLHNVGCSGQVSRCVRLGDGSVRILVEGIERMAVDRLAADAEAGIAGVATPQQVTLRDPEQVQRIALELRQGLRQLIEADTQLPAGLARIAELDLDPSRLADRIVANTTLEYDDRVAFLAEPVVDNRLAMALEYLGRELSFRTLSSQIRSKTNARMDKQQRDFYIREQIRALKSELGDSPESLDEADQLEQKLRSSGMPEDSLEEALKELDRLRRMPPDAAEYNVTRTWLDWLISMPWGRTTEDNTDLVEARKVLDTDHDGLDKVKDRILEHLAVTQLNPEGKAPILSFVGPPGVGKTTLGQSIANALGREFQRVSLGGVKDEAEIRGHRRTYVGALPGRIVNAIKRAGTRNPVIVLDEIDKLGADFRGDPTSALLEVLDPEQNHTFVDHYLSVPFDLSQVLFVCTANMQDHIPDALYDRLEMIEIPGYIQEEKVHIARHHLLPRLRTSHGLEDRPFQVMDTAVNHIIEAYTQEAGLRGLERELAGLHRKAARLFVEGRKRGIRIDTPVKVAKLLGPPRHFPEIAERVDAPGVALGLAWTFTGGDILFIEATSLPNTTELKLTGSLGEVMKESAEAAMSLIQSRHGALDLPEEVVASRGLHLHVPAGSIPKDGPSAGVTMLTAIASLLTGRKARPYVAMSGEITLRGKVLPVGGVREKVLAARRAKVREVILPRHNEKDLVDVPEQLRQDLSYHFVDTVDEVLELALEPR